MLPWMLRDKRPITSNTSTVSAPSSPVAIPKMVDESHTLEKANLTHHSLPPIPVGSGKIIQPRPNQQVTMSSVRASAAFYLADGKVLWTLNELANELDTMPDWVYSTHVTNEKNDFANWIAGCFPGSVSLIAETVRNSSRKSLSGVLRADKAPTQKAMLPSVPHAMSVASRKPLPNSPLSGHPDKRLQELADQIHAIRMQAVLTSGEAREAFAQLRSRLWSECSDEERRVLLPKLRETYDAIKAHV